jgi:general secretion pathway protein A
MYTGYFGFKENPFNLTPDPRYLFLSHHHKEALEHMLYGVNERKGFIVIAGGIGTGKTTLCRAFLSQLDRSIKSALIFNSFLTEMELLETLMQEFGIGQNAVKGTKKEYIDKLNEFLLETFRLGGNAVLVIDEAQNLSHTVLEQIRMLSNLETEKEKLLQIVLVGQPELKDLLASSLLRQLNERVMVRYELKPLDRKDVQGYVEHRLVVGGGRGDLRFKNAALRRIYRYSQGNPRRINAVCDRALLIAYANEKHVITARMVTKAVDELRGGITERFEVADWTLRRAISSTVLILLLIAVAGFAGWSFRDYIVALFSGERKAAAVNTADVSLSAATPQKDAGASLFLDEKDSLAGLFGLFHEKMGETPPFLDDGYLGLVFFAMEPEHFMRFKKPFRVHLHDSNMRPQAAYTYILIREITEGGAIAVDAEGKERMITRDFMANHVSKGVSWIYPYENARAELMRGMSGHDVAEVQRLLNEIGHEIEPTGVFDEKTFLEVLRFQRSFGLMSDGIVGRRTRSLLYQMTN